MTDEQKDPQPTESGADGTQQPAVGVASTEVVPRGHEVSQPVSIFSETISGLASVRYRSMGGEMAAALFAGWSQEKANELRDVKAELGQVRNENNRLSQVYGEVRVESAVLKERLSTESRTKHLKNLAIFSGTTLLGLAFKLGESQAIGYAITVGLLGTVLLLVGWFFSPRQEK